MNRSIRAIRPRAHRVRLALLGGLLATTLTGVLAGPVRADGYEHGPGRRAWQDHGREHGRGPPPRYEGPRYQGYYREPDVYYQRAASGRVPAARPLAELQLPIVPLRVSGARRLSEGS